MSSSAIDAMLAKHDLLDLLARFDDAAISNNLTAFRTLWTADAIWEIGDPIPMKVQGLEAIVKSLANFKEQNIFFFRLTGRPVIEISGNQATLRSPTVELAARAGQQGYANVAVYEDKAVHGDGVWRFSSRNYKYIWVDTQVRLKGQVAPGID